MLVAAHNEADHIGACIESLRAQTYPSDLVQIVVVADNCTDDTARIARSAGAEALVRNQPEERGKGRALRFGIEQLMPRRFDAIVVVDADSVAEPDFLTHLTRPLEEGADAVQGESLLSERGSAEAALQAAAFLLINRVRPAGRAALGLPSKLSGNGMLFSRRLLLEHPWDAFTSVEDLEYSIKLRQAGVRTVFARGAVLRSAPAPNTRAAESQRLRYEGGKFRMARTYVPRLAIAAIRTRRPLLLDTAFELALPPLSLLTFAAAAEMAVGAVLVWQSLLGSWALIPGAVALAAILLFVPVGLYAGYAPRSAYLALARAPLFVTRKALRSYRLLRSGADGWVRTERPSDRAPDIPA